MDALIEQDPAGAASTRPSNRASWELSVLTITVLVVGVIAIRSTGAPRTARPAPSVSGAVEIPAATTDRQPEAIVALPTNTKGSSEASARYRTAGATESTPR